MSIAHEQWVNLGVWSDVALDSLVPKWVLRLAPSSSCCVGLVSFFFKVSLSNESSVCACFVAGPGR